VGEALSPFRGQVVIARSHGIARSGVYRPRPANDDGVLALMRRIDALFMAWPFLGSRRMTAMLRADGLTVNRKRVQRLMRLMGIALAIDRPNLWAADITYVPIGRGFLYLVAIID
jgi:putative transposase